MLKLNTPVTKYTVTLTFSFAQTFYPGRNIVPINVKKNATKVSRKRKDIFFIYAQFNIIVKRRNSQKISRTHIYATIREIKKYLQKTELTFSDVRLSTLHIPFDFSGA